MRAADRLEMLKSACEDEYGIERFVSLTNPKNVELMETLVAWTCAGVQFDADAEVDPSASMEDMWALSDCDMRRFAETAGLKMVDAIAKLRQLQSLGLIFPDGDALSKARSIIKVYVKGKIEAMDKK